MPIAHALPRPGGRTRVEGTKSCKTWVGVLGIAFDQMTERGEKRGGNFANIASHRLESWNLTKSGATEFQTKVDTIQYPPPHRGSLVCWRRSVITSGNGNVTRCHAIRRHCTPKFPQNLTKPAGFFRGLLREERTDLAARYPAGRTQTKIPFPPPVTISPVFCPNWW